MIFDVEKSTESIALNFTESVALDPGYFSGEWRHVQVDFDMEASAASVSIDNRLFLEKAPLLQLPKASILPEINVTYGTGFAAEVWMDNLAIKFQDRSGLLVGISEAAFEPIIGDAFDRYFTGEFPLPGGWLFHLPADQVGEDRRLADDASVSKTDSDKTQVDQTAGSVIQPSTFANIDNAESVTPVRSFKFKLAGASSAVIAKMFQVPSRRPYDISSANFSISPVDELAQIMDKMIAERTSTRAKSGGSNETSTSSASTQSGAAMSTLSVPRTGSYYIYTFDGRLLAEYDLYGTCLRDYIYMGNRLIAEYAPASGQYYYYTQDQIGSTRIVTNDSGTVVYAEAHDPYGGIQKTWVNAFDPKRKFSDKERDGETGLDYFGARYYSAPEYSEGHTGSYRWLSIDPVFNTFAVLADPQASNLYSYCRNNPLSLYDPDGREVICKDRAAFEALKRTLGDPTLASKLTWDEKTGKVSIEGDVSSDNPNFISLQELIRSDQVVEISLADKVSFIGKDGTEYKDMAFVYYPKDASGFFGIVLTPKKGRPASTVHDGKGILVVVADSALKEYPLEQTRTLAEELYGHAYLYIIGCPFLHEKRRRIGKQLYHCDSSKEVLR